MKRREAWLVVGAAAIMIAIAFPGILRGEVFFFRDIYRYFVPGKVAIARALAGQELPLWNPFVFTGAPLLAQLGLGVAYPFNALFIFLSPGRAITIMIVIHYALALFAMYKFLRGCELDHAAALVGATAFAWSGPILCDSAHVSHLTLYWIQPLLLLCVRRVDGMRLGIRIALLWALAITTGSVERLLVMAVILLGYAALSGGWRRLGWTTAGLATAAMLTAPVWLPAILFARESSTRAGGFSWEEATQESLPAELLGSLAVPYSFVTAEGRADPAHLFQGGFPLYGSLYFGITVFLLAGLGFEWRRRMPDSPGPRRRESFFWTAVAVLALLLALGRQSPLYAALWEFGGIFRSFRYPVKYTAFTGLAISIMAGHGMQRLLVKPVPVSEWMARAAGAAIVMLPPAYALIAAAPDSVTRRLAAILPVAMAEAAAFALALFVLVRIFQSRRAILVPLVVGLVFLDLISPSARFAPTTASSFFAPPPAAAMIGSDRFISGEEWSRHPSQIAMQRGGSTAEQGRLGVMPNMGAVWGMFHADGYEGVVPSAAQKFLDAVSIADDSGQAALWGGLAVKWRLHPSQAPALPPPWKMESTDPATGVTVYSNPLARPRVRIEGSAGNIGAFHQRFNSMVMEVESDSPAELVIGDLAFPGWKAYSREREIRITRTAAHCRSIAIPSGKSRIVLEYEPAGLHTGMYLSGLGLLVLCLLIVAEKMRHPRLMASLSSHELAGITARPSTSSGRAEVSFLLQRSIEAGRRWSS